MATTDDETAAPAKRKPTQPHQVNLVMQVHGDDGELRDALEAVLVQYVESGAVWKQTDPDDRTDRGWHWHGLKAVK